MVESIFKTKKAKNIALHDTRENLKLQILQIDGNTEQNTTSGKNLLDMSNARGGKISGITVAVNADGSYSYKGTAEQGAINVWLLGNWSLTNELFTLPKGTYYVKGVNLYYSNLTLVQGRDGVVVTFPADQSISGVRAVNAVEGTTYNEIHYPIIARSDVAVDWEPFTNGASPNPDYPQEIKSVEVSEIKTCRKNLLNQSVLLQGTISANDGYTIGTSTSILYSPYFTKLKRGESYIFNIRNSIRIYKYDKYKKFIESVIVTNAFIADCEYIRYQSNNFTEENQLEIGTVSTEYEPYTESKATLSNPITLNGLNGVQDYVDVKRGVLVQKFKEITFNGSESWSFVSDNSIPYFHTLCENFGFKNHSTLNYMCDSFRAIVVNDRYQENTMFLNDTGRAVFTTSSFTTLDEWKAHLQSNPMTVVYELAEPIETPLSEADVEALESLKTFEGLTYVVLDSEINPKSISVLYELLQYRIDWTNTDFFNAEDYNRIISNIAYLKAYLDSLFLGLTNISTMEEKTFESLIYAREIDAIETALETLNIETYKFDIGETKEYLPNTRTLDFVELNRIESAILLLYKTMTAQKEALPKLAFTLGGQKGFKV